MIEIKEMMQHKEIPFLNEPISMTKYAGPYLTQPANYDTILTWVKKTPEAMGIINALITDIMSDGYTINALKKTKADANIEGAEEFMKKNYFKDEMKATLWDWFMFGDAALWKGKITTEQIKEKLRSRGIEVKSDVIGAMDEDLYKTKSFRHIAWSSMNIRYDDTDITGYKQVVKGKKEKTFTTEEIIHGRFMPLDGKVYGFSPIRASLSSITTLGLMKDYNGRYFEHGGAPDHMFILAKEMAGSPHAEKLRQTLETYNHRMRGNLVFTGEVEVKDINAFNKDMEFRLLAIYHTGILALAFNMPMARLSSVLGQEVKGSATGDSLEDAGYWRTIAEAQDYWETLLNTELFEPEFGVKLKFNRSYLQDEVREVQIAMIKADVITKTNAELQKYGMKLSLDYLNKYFGFKEDDVEKGKLELPMMQTGLDRQNMLNKHQVLNSPSKTQKDEAKRKQQTGL